MVAIRLTFCSKWALQLWCRSVKILFGPPILQSIVERHKSENNKKGKSRLCSQVWVALLASEFFSVRCSLWCCSLWPLKKKKVDSYFYLPRDSWLSILALLDRRPASQSKEPLKSRLFDAPWKLQHIVDAPLKQLVRCRKLYLTKHVFIFECNDAHYSTSLQPPMQITKVNFVEIGSGLCFPLTKMFSKHKNKFREIERELFYSYLLKTCWCCMGSMISIKREYCCAYW